MRTEEGRNIFTSLPIVNKSKDNDEIFSQASIRASLRPHPNSNLSPISCLICIQNQSGKFTKCQHEIYCSNCAEYELRESLKNGRKPKCGFPNCNASVIDEEGLFKNFDQELKKQYRTLASRSFARLSKLSFNHCQKPDCDGYIENDTHCCNICRSKHCSLCNRMSHEGACLGLTFLSEDLNLKKCNICKNTNYKEGGCSKFRCQHCNAEICYECGEAWSMRHHGCAQGGWFLLPWNFFSQCCHTAQNTLKEQHENERIV